MYISTTPLFCLFLILVWKKGLLCKLLLSLQTIKHFPLTDPFPRPPAVSYKLQSKNETNGVNPPCGADLPQNGLPRSVPHPSVKCGRSYAIVLKGQRPLPESLSVIRKRALILRSEWRERERGEFAGTQQRATRSPISIHAEDTVH